jgi:leader peptidase (prepilin peptidase)/N-methyltransferase
MDTILSIPMSIRLAIVFALGACVGAAANWAIYRLAWNRRPIGPWSRPDPSAPRRRPSDRLPIVGWLGLRREAALHGPGFWVRPMLIEILTGAGLAWLYWWEIGALGLLPPDMPQWLVTLALPVVHLEFAAHLILIGLMLAASMIDVDEKTIPDGITVAGTLVGLLVAAGWPNSLLPDIRLDGFTPRYFLQLAAPHEWPATLGGVPNLQSLILGLACWLAWCFAILPRSWYSRHGWLRAARLCWARVTREPSTPQIARMAMIGSAVIGLIWFREGLAWQGLLTALVGMAASGGFVWAVRVVASAALHREAMGFGDVTLMAMIGAFMGWQPCLFIFFLAPFAGIVLGVFVLVLFRDREIPYGPFLCLATLVVIVRWDSIWNYPRIQEYFAVGWLVPTAVLGCLALMALMLGAWRLILKALR